MTAGIWETESSFYFFVVTEKKRLISSKKILMNTWNNSLNEKEAGYQHWTVSHHFIFFQGGLPWLPPRAPEDWLSAILQQLFLWDRWGMCPVACLKTLSRISFLVSIHRMPWAPYVPYLTGAGWKDYVFLQISDDFQENLHSLRLPERRDLQISQGQHWTALLQ